MSFTSFCVQNTQPAKLISLNSTLEESILNEKRFKNIKIFVSQDSKNIIEIKVNLDKL